MKRLLLLILAIGFLAAIALAVFIATFDADRYRPQLVQMIEEASGLNVRLNHLALGWHGGVALDLQGLTLSERGSSAEPLLELDAASALVRLAPLLQRRIEVASVVLHRPRASLRRDRQSRLIIPIPASSPSARPAPSASGGADGASAPSAVSFNIARLRIEDGTLHWADAAAVPPVELWVKRVDATIEGIAPGHPMDVRLQAAVAGDTPNLRFSCRLTSPAGPGSPGALHAASLKLDQLALEAVAPPAPAGAPQLRGRLSASVEGEAPSLEPAVLQRALSARGKIRMDQPVVANLNILRDVFQRLSVVPGLMERLEARLPETYRKKLEAKDTTLQPFETPFDLADGSLRFSGLTLQSDTLGLSGGGSAGLDGELAMQAVLRIDPQFSEAIIRSVEELRALANPQGELELPLVIQGRGAQVSIRPDAKYVASKVLTTAAVDALGRLLRREQPSSSGAAGSAPPQEQAPDAGALLGQLLQRALDRRAPPESSPASAQPDTQ